MNFKYEVSCREFLDLYHWFKRYVHFFYKDKEGHDRWVISLKYEHTLRVCKGIVSIARELGLETGQLFLAKTIGLFHDVGRFPQYEQYGTFRDSISENHALLSVKVLKEHGVLDDFPAGAVDLILKSVEYHNIKRLPDDLPEELDFYSRLIRDADKLDVLHVLIGLYENPSELNSTIELDLPDGDGYSLPIVEDILSCKISDLSHMRCKNDMKLMLLSWIFDINFSPTLKQIRSKRYVERLISFLPQDDTIRNLETHILGFIDSRLQTG